MSVAAWEDVATALGRSTSEFTDAQKAQIQWWLDGAELLLRSRLGAIEDLDQDTVTYVEAEVVAEKARPYLAENVASSVTVTADDGTVTRRYENRVTAADVTDDLWALFGSATTGSAYTVQTYAPLDVP